MKKTFFSLILICSGTILFAQNDRDRNNHDRNHDNNTTTPQQVQQAFSREHTNAGNANWSQTNGQWHAIYNDNTNHRNVDDYYDNRGRHMYSRVEWDRKNLPRDYDRKIRTRYHTTEYRVTRIERPRNQSLFEIILNIGGRDKTVYTDERGNEVRYTPGR